MLYLGVILYKDFLGHWHSTLSEINNEEIRMDELLDIFYPSMEEVLQIRRWIFQRGSCPFTGLSSGLFLSVNADDDFKVVKHSHNGGCISLLWRATMLMIQC